jgi:sugar/nucleoside kinase (ribokinase family)
LATDIGADQNGEDCMAELKRNNVNTHFMHRHKDKPTNYHFVLWYTDDRTILINHVEYITNSPTFLSRQNGCIFRPSLQTVIDYQVEISDYLKKNPGVKLCFQPGTFQMKLGIQKLKEIYQRTEVFVVNVEEAQRILNNQTRDIKVLLAETSCTRTENSSHY